MTSGAALDLTFPRRTRRNTGRNVKSAALAVGSAEAPFSSEQNGFDVAGACRSHRSLTLAGRFRAAFRVLPGNGVGHALHVSFAPP